MMNQYRKLIKNSSIFAIANLGSKLLTIILVPFYTYVLSQAEYGTVDLITTTASLILPIVTFNIFESTLRFSIKSQYKYDDIFSISIVGILFGNIIFILFYPLIYKVEILNENLFLFYLLIFMQSFNAVLSQFCRGIGKVKAFAINGLLNTSIILILNIILLVKFKSGIFGYLLSIVIANFICNILMFAILDLKKYLKFSKLNFELLKEMLIYAVPLIPNSLVWWIINLSDRYAILFFLGPSANGIYAVANKVPTILSLLNTIFNQAWQISAIEQGDQQDTSKFYNNVFSFFSTVMISGTSLLLLVLRPILGKILSETFSVAWRFIPFLLISVIFLSFSSFLGTNYLVMKRTTGIFKTTVIGAIINVILNLILIPIIGINGAALSTMISFFIVWIIRVYDTKKFVRINIEWKYIFFNIIILFIQIYVLYMDNNMYLILECLLSAMIFFINRKNIKIIFNKLIIMSKFK